MSADRQRLKSAIRAIALTPEERRQLLGEGQNKGGKASSAGVGTSEAEESRLCCDGSTSANANPGTGERDPDSGGQGGGLDSDDPARLDMGDGTLSGVTDCATGDPVCMDGSGFIPPDGWDSPTEGPPLESYRESYFWAPSNLSNSGLPTGEQYCESINRLPFIANSLGDSGRCEGGTSFISIARYECVEGNTSPACTGEAEPYTQDTWPQDGCANLAIVNGKIVGSKYDPENDGSYSAPRDSIDLCDSEGNQISLAPSANGGWKTINSTTDNGYLYDSSGRQIAHIDGNEYSDPSV